MLEIKNITDARDLWSIAGSFGEVNGKVEQVGSCFTNTGDGYVVTTDFRKDQRGVFTYNTVFKNTSEAPVTLHSADLKFVLDGGEYDVYTQYNGWQNESAGGWQSLVTSVSAFGRSARCTEDAAPFAVLWNNQNSRGTAFHLVSYGGWEICINRVRYYGVSAVVEVELGYDSKNLALTVLPGQELALPAVIAYRVKDKVGMDSFKLHGYMNENYPARELPVIYNTWLYKFDRITVENVAGQIKAARDLGAEYFVVDAGWFGKGREWWSARGDWSENLTAGFCGHMDDVARMVRENGMKFGFWLEPETASPESDIVRLHPEYFIGYKDAFLLDFANPDAVEHIFEKTCHLIDRYGAEFVKFDFNNPLRHDRTCTAFTRYFEGYMDYINRLCRKYPELYIQNCASGGARMGLRDCMHFPSFWPTDNQSPFEGVRIVKDSLLRFPPSRIERWISVRSLTDFGPVYMSDENTEKILSCNDATWDNIAGVDESWLYAFMTGGPVGLTFDLNSLSENEYGRLKSFIAEFKKRREFYRNSVCRLLCDTETVTVLQYSDEELSDSEIIVYPKMVRQKQIRIFPAVSPGADYEVDKTGCSAADISEDGISVRIEDKFKAVKIILKKM